jgi:hypothetical protein
VVGKNLAELGETLRPVQLRLAVEDARTTGRVMHLDEVRLLSTGGTPLFLRFQVSPVLDRGGNLLQRMLWGRSLTQEHLLGNEPAKTR